MRIVRAALPPEVNQTSGAVVDAAFKVHSGLGPGLLESVYEKCLAHELGKKRLNVSQQLSLPIVYDSLRLEGALGLTCW